MMQITINAIDKWDAEISVEGLTIEDEIDKMEEVFYERHTHRVSSGVCSYENAEHYLETLSNVERMGDHLTNILEGIKDVEYCKNAEFDH